MSHSGVLRQLKRRATDSAGTRRIYGRKFLPAQRRFWRVPKISPDCALLLFTMDHDSLSGPGRRSAYFIRPALDDNDLLRRYVLILVLDHEETLAIRCDIVIGGRQAGSAARAAHPVRVVAFP